MSEFIGSQISLISKSNIRYTGWLHEINSEEASVSLRSVRSYGTEGREESPDKAIPARDEIYEFIKFRGSDVKDLQINSAAPSQPMPAPPNDPAIIGSRRPDGMNNGPVSGPGPTPSGPAYGVTQNAPAPGPGGPAGTRGAGGPVGPAGPAGPGGPGGPGYGYGNQYYGGGWNNGAMPGPNGYYGMPYPPGPPGPHGPGYPGYNFPGPGGMPGGPMGPDGPANAGRPNPMNGSSSTASLAPTKPSDASASKDQKVSSTGAHTQAHTQVQPNQPNQPSQPSQPVAPMSQTRAAPLQAAVAAEQKPSNLPAIPTEASIQDATEAAKAAVALAMAKINSQTNSAGAMESVTKRVGEIRIHGNNNNYNNYNNHGYNQRGNNRGNRGGNRGYHRVVVPDEDFDFASANAKFNKSDLTESSVQHVEAEAGTEAEKPPAYNKSTSFFDNISSESKDRAENGGQKPGGREWRGEEQRRNVETFGQGTVDGGYRNNRGRGRGRGFRGRGRGGQSNGFQNRQNRGVSGDS